MKVVLLRASFENFDLDEVLGVRALHGRRQYRPSDSGKPGRLPAVAQRHARRTVRARCCEAQPGLFGAVASDPTVSRLITALAADAPAALSAINAARAAARRTAWGGCRAAGAPDHGIDDAQPLIIDVDATLVTAHSDKECAAPNFRRGFGFHPLCAFVEHAPAGTGEPLAMLLRPANAGANIAADHKTVQPRTAS